MQLNPYLNFNGNCRAAFEYYEQHLGGKIRMMMSYADMPGASDTSEQAKKTILHGSMTVGGVDLLASDVMRDDYAAIRSSYLCLGVDSIEEAERVYQVLTDGGEHIMPLQETFWAHRYGICRDRFGVLWMINAAPPMPTAP